MPAFRFTRRAEADLLGIANHTLHTWGEKQTARYLRQLEVCCQMLAENPSAGRPCENIRAGLHRFEHGMHVVFYRSERNGILISRILHQSMLPEKHDQGDQQGSS
jgi:toxin ParE1/3/4